MVEKITRWGWVSLLGIVLSTSLGIAAQFKESNDNARQALEAAKRSEKTLQEIRKICHL